jgi:predicted peptidase
MCFVAMFAIAALPSLATGCAAAVPSVIATNPGTVRFLPIGTAGDDQSRGYVEYVPEGYYGNNEWPCIIFLHGDGELGDGTTVEGMQAFNYACLIGMIQNDSWDDRHRFVVLAPQFKDYPDRSAIHVRDFVEYAKRAYRIDPKRIYFSAVSGGGVALGNYLNAYSGGDAAAVVPVSCYVPPTTSAKWKSVPVWFMCGASDTTVKPENVAKNYNSIVNAAPPVMPRITLYTGVGHDGNSATKSYSPRSMDNAFETAYQGISLVPYSNVYDWLLQYRKE